MERKGILFFVHGYGLNTNLHCFLAERFAQHGYEFCGIDQRGFGRSEGTRGRIESFEDSMADIMQFNETYYEQYGRIRGRDTPCFLLGTSLGGLFTANIATRNHMQYAGVCHAVPLFGLKDPEYLESMLPIVEKVISWKADSNIPFKDYKKVLKKHCRDWISEPDNKLASTISPNNFMQYYNGLK